MRTILSFLSFAPHALSLCLQSEHCYCMILWEMFSTHIIVAVSAAVEASNLSLLQQSRSSRFRKRNTIKPRSEHTNDLIAQ